jgi:hypothetical protein
MIGPAMVHHMRSFPLARAHKSTAEDKSPAANQIETTDSNVRPSPAEASLKPAEVAAPPAPCLTPGPAGQPVDGLELWDTEALDNSVGSLSAIRLDQNERLVIPFTTSLVRKELHYLSFAAVQGYVLCNGPDCLLCRVGRQQDVRDLLPVYDVLDRAVGVLAIGPNQRPHALRPAIAPVLRRVARGEGPLLLTLCKQGYKYVAGAQPLPAGADDGAAAIRDFRDRFEAGMVDLTAAFQRLANEDLAAIDEVKNLMTAKGITP